MKGQRFDVLRDELAWDGVQSAGPQAVRAFNRMLKAGESVAMAAQLAVRKPPTGGVDEQLIMRNSMSVTEQFKGCEAMLGMYRKKYKEKTGENLPEDAVVYRSLVDEPGDPGAIVTHKHSLADVKRTMRERNKLVEGDWENHPVQQAPQPQVLRMNDMVMNRYKSEYRMEEEFVNLPEPELEELIIDNHTKVVTADDAMNAPTSLDKLTEDVFGGRGY